MEPSVLSPETETSGRRRQHDARLLADSLRTSRVTLLYGDNSTSRSELLIQGVLPLLRRRTEDRTVGSGRGARHSRPVVERRLAKAGRKRRTERVVLFNDWEGAPLAALEVAILSALPMGVVLQTQHQRLADLLAELGERLDTQFLIIFDGLERLWDVGSRAEAVDEFVEQFGDAINRPNANANFLLSIDQALSARLEAVRSRVPGFDDSTLRLDAAGPMASQASRALLAAVVAPPKSTEAPSAVPAPVRIERPKRKRVRRPPVPPPAPIKTEGVYAFIESTLSQTTDASAPWHGAAGPAATAVAAKEPAARPPLAAGGKMAPSSAAVSIRENAENHRSTPFEPASPIDQWLDMAISWCRRLLRRR